MSNIYSSFRKQDIARLHKNTPTNSGRGGELAWSVLRIQNDNLSVRFG